MLRRSGRLAALVVLILFAAGGLVALFTDSADPDGVSGSEAQE